MPSLAMLLLLGVSAAPGGQRLAVLELKPLGASPDLAHTLTGVIAEEAGKIPGFLAISQEEIGAMLGLERQKQMLGCGNESCLAEIGGALGARKVISGSLGKVGVSFVLQLELVDTSRAKVLDRESKTVTDQGDLLMAARDLTHRLLTGTALDTTGKIKLAITPEGAKVLLDGKAVGTTPLAAPLPMEEGKHKILIEKDGYVSYEATVEAVRGQTLFNEVQLVSIAPIEAVGRTNWAKTVGWISLGASVAAFGAATYFGIEANQNYASYQGAIYNTGDPSIDLLGATYYKQQTVAQQTPANVAFVAGGVTVALAVALEIWGYLQKPTVRATVGAEK
jgi:hypothetical protein